MKKEEMEMEQRYNVDVEDHRNSVFHVDADDDNFTGTSLHLLLTSAGIYF